jgi:SAM dependent carboxyl methyltransferase
MGGIPNLLADQEKLSGRKTTSPPIATHGVMEGGGAYNLHARVPAGGGKLAVPFLEQAVEAIPFNDKIEPVVIADYGSSQGKNSLAPITVATRALRSRLGPDRPICVVHIDQAANDFNTLFSVLHSDPERYSLDDANIFPSAIGRSFYESVLPKGHVHLGWCSYAVVWLSRIPTPIPGHFVVTASTGDVRAAFDRQAAEDWKLFLSLRADELRPGGRLVVVLPGVNEEGTTGFESLFEHANESIAEMVAKSAITAEERRRMVLGAYPRRRNQLLEPFAADNQYCGLTVERYDLSALGDAAWSDYEHDGNAEVLAKRHAAFFRAIFVPSLATALSDARKRQSFADELEETLARRLTARPVPLDSVVETMVLERRT